MHCRAERMARSDEKFFRIRHSCGEKKRAGLNRTNSSAAAQRMLSSTHPGHVDPPLDQPGPLVGLQRGVAQAGGDHAVGDGVELSHGGSDGGGQVLLPLLVPLRPDPPQAVVWHHLLEQVLDGQRATPGH